jgi:cobalt/nickel transport system permease protein
LLHRLPAHCKIVATLVFVTAVVITPASAFWAFGILAGMVYGVARASDVPLSILARRLTIEIPFVLFALFLPFVAAGERIEVFSIAVSRPGLLAAWNLVAKATLGLAAGALLASCTQPAELVHGLGRLRMPKIFVAISGFMVRYVDVISGEMRRMRIARESRAYAPSRLGQARAAASSAGTLFIRSFERGERVHTAMLSRGYAGSVPLAEAGEASSAEWFGALLIPATALLVASFAQVVS